MRSWNLIYSVGLMRVSSNFVFKKRDILNYLIFQEFSKKSQNPTNSKFVDLSRHLQDKLRELQEFKIVKIRFPKNNSQETPFSHKNFPPQIRKFYHFIQKKNRKIWTKEKQLIQVNFIIFSKKNKKFVKENFPRKENIINYDSNNIYISFLSWNQMMFLPSFLFQGFMGKVYKKPFDFWFFVFWDFRKFHFF
jgi:hypothetical protein